MLVVTDLRKHFGQRLAVDGLGFEIGRGEIYGLLGPNGAGKTTTISMIAGIIEREAGEVLLDGASLDLGAPVRGRIGIVPQEITLYLDLTGTENLQFWGRMYGLEGKELERGVATVLRAVGLEDRADDTVATYSGGMQRRLNLAAGVVHSPALLILDEPTVGVDPQSRAAIFDWVEQLRDDGMAILYTTHYMEEAERLCDRIGIIDAGRMIAEGTREELVSSIADKARIEVGFDMPGHAAKAIQVVTGLEGVHQATADDECLTVVADAGSALLPALLSALIAASLPVAKLQLIESNLEDVFLKLTGKALRD